MSPSGEMGMLEPVVAVIERNATVQRLMDLHFGSCKTKPPRLRMDLESLAFPLHDVVVADDAFVSKAADAFQILRSGPPGQFGCAGPAGEAAIVVGDEKSQDAIGRVQVACVGQTEFAREAILEHAPEARSMRPLAWGVCAAMKVMPSCWRARPNWVG